MKVRNLIGSTEDIEQEQSVPELCLPRNAIGIEYEWENAADRFPVGMDGPPGLLGKLHIPGEKLGMIQEVQKYFDAHIDGSLRQKGLEFTFKGPYVGSRIIRAIDSMDACARALEFTGSYRTSLHIHLDMRDRTFPDDVVQFGAVYCLVESFLYQFVGHQRSFCNYCIPWHKHPQQFENFLTILRTHHVSNSAHVVQAMKHGKGNKYSGLNCFAIGDFGTVEFRHAPVTLQRDQIIQWINIIMRIKKWCNEHPMTPSSFVEYIASRTATSVLAEIFEAQYHDVTKRSRNLDADYWNGTETLYQFVSAS